MSVGTAARQASTTAANFSSEAVAPGVSPATSPARSITSQSGSPIVAASVCSRPIVVCPRPRRGMLMMRSRRCSSAGLATRRQVGQRVLDLGALVEARAADHLVGDRVAPELFLEHARLGVRAVEHGDVVGGEGPGRPLAPHTLVEQLADLAGDEPRLGVLVGHFDDADRCAHAARGPQVLALAAAVVGDHGVRHVEDLRGRAVVLLEADHLGVGVVALELEDVADVGAAPRVDRLVVVAHHGEVAALAGQQVRDAVLGVVGVLVFVDHDVAEGAPVVLEPVGEELEQVDRLHEQVVEVHRAHLDELLLVELVDVGGGPVEIAAAELLAEGRRVLQAVLGVGDGAGDRVGREALVVEVELCEAALDEAFGVVGVVDREGRAIAEALGLAPQDARAHRVEGRDPHDAHHWPDQAGDAFAHLRRRLVGEGDGEDLVGAHAMHAR